MRSRGTSRLKRLMVETCRVENSQLKCNAAWRFLKWHTVLTSATEAPQLPFRSGSSEAAAPVWGVSDVVATWRYLALSQRETSSSERTSNVIKRKTLVLHVKKNTRWAFTCAGNESAVTVMNISPFMLWFLRLLNFFCPFLRKTSFCQNAIHFFSFFSLSYM